MFNRKAIEELEGKVRSIEGDLQSVQKEKTDLEIKLKTAQKEKADLETLLNSTNEKISELEEKLKNTDYDELKEQAKKAAVEFEGLKELYTEKIKEFEESRESKEEAFAKEAALKRNNLDEEIQANRSENQDRVTNSVRAFTGSYMYYMDQIRLLMEALNQAATETGKTLFASEVEDVKECFGARIAEHLRKDVGELKQGTGDRLLISGANEERIVARIKP